MNSSRILIVDDDPSIQKIVGTNLRARHFDVAQVEDGESALHMLGQGHVDLVILDIMMPGIDGIEVCRRIRERSRVPVLMLSAKNELDDRLTSFDVGADDYITKPFAIDELLARVHAILRRRAN